MIARTRPRLAAGVLGAAVALVGCAINPATGGLDFMLVSHDEEEAIGQWTHREVLAEFGGVYYDPTLANYVENVGQRVARTTEIQDFEYSFTVLDTPSVNAFAIPGGYVYVTRGLLALVSSEDELAGVLGHELAHVNARHGAQRLSRMKARERICETVTCDAEVPVLGDLATIGATLAFEGFTQDQEFEADRLGIRYLRRAGYDPAAMESFLRKLKAQAELDSAVSAADDTPSDSTGYSNTHPLTRERIDRVRASAGGPAVVQSARGENEYLSIVDGMLYGNRREYGFVVGRTYAHPIRRIAFTVPEGFTMRADSRRVTALGPDDSVILFEPSRLLFTGPMEGYLTGVWAEGIALEDIRPLTINGMEAATGWVRQDTPAGLFDFRLVAIRIESGVIYRFLFATRAHMTERLSEPLREATYSFRRLDRGEAESLKPRRLRVVAAGSGDTLESLAASSAFADSAMQRLSIMNGLDGTEIAAGQLVKIVGE